jgi:transglutaminase-like putative cysteine protease
VVEDVEQLGADLKIDPFADFRALHDAEVGVRSVGPLSKRRGYNQSSMDRRTFLRAAAAAPAVFTLRNPRHLSAAGIPGGWRTFEVSTRIELRDPFGVTRLWIPAALIRETPYQKTLSNTFRVESGTVKRVEDRTDGLAIVAAEFPAGVAPVLTVTSRVSTRNWAVSLAAPAKPVRTGRAELSHYLRPTRLIPTDGIVKETAGEITRGARTDLEKARAIYEWIVENTYRNPKTRGCGLGDIRFMLESRDLGGKCADLNALYVGLARAAGLPARDVYGIRAAPSELGFKSLGASSEIVSKAQHCRAEVFLNDYGWVPVDPADVRKVMLEEPPGNRPLDDAMVKSARARLFGSWEMNWIAYNFAHDVALPGSNASPRPFLMYPEAETADGRRDSLDPDTFRYEIRSREITRL